MDNKKLIAFRSLILPQRICPKLLNEFDEDCSHPISAAVAPIITPYTPTKEAATVAPAAIISDRNAISFLLSIYL